MRVPITPHISHHWLLSIFKNFANMIDGKYHIVASLVSVKAVPIYLYSPQMILYIYNHVRNLLGKFSFESTQDEDHLLSGTTNL